MGKKPKREKLKGTAKLLVELRNFIIIAGTAWLTLVGTAFLIEANECVEMPNGFLIGRASLFSSMYFTAPGGPDVALRTPEGKLFLRGNNYMHFWDEEGFGGEYQEDRNGLVRYVYLNDTGLIRDKDFPELYQAIYAAKVREHESNRRRTDSQLMHLYLRLKDDKDAHAYCKTNWLLLDWPK